LVRGLDYYRHTAFEFVSDRLGAQGTVLGGGRYDGLIENLGGPATPAVGWAAGIERLAMLVHDRPATQIEAMIVVEHDEGLQHAFRLLKQLRLANISADMVATGSTKKRYDKAVKQNPIAILRVNEDGYYGYSSEGKDDRLREYFQSLA